MNIDDLLNIMRREAERVVERRASGLRIGTVSSYDPVTHSVKLLLQPEGTESGWCPVSTDGVGSGFGRYCGPQTSQAFLVYFHEGDVEGGVILGRVPTDHEQPFSVQPGEIADLTPWGSFIKLLQNGSVIIADQQGATLAFDGSGNITVTAKGGQTIVMNAAGGIVLTDKQAATVTLDGSGNITMTGKAGQTIVLDASGNIILTPAGSGLVKLGGSGASIAIARNADTVTSGHVVATSTKVVSL
jgi:hypothetical protein